MKKTLLVICMALISVSAQAKAPQIEFFLTKYDGKNCLVRAVIALEKAGFTLKSGTYKGEDRVGYLGSYKGAVGCSTEVPKSVVFVVSGSDYGTAKKLASKIQSNF